MTYNIYAAYSNTLSRTGHSLTSLTKALQKARQMSFSYPAVEVRERLPRGTEVIREIFVAGAPISGQM